MQTYQIPGTNKEFVEVEGPFDKCIDALVREKAELTSCVQLADARIKLGANHRVSTTGSWTGENFNYLLNDDILVAKARYNLILKFSKIATDWHGRWSEFYLDKATLEQLQDLAEENPADAIKSGVLLLKRKDIQPINTSNPDSNKLGVFLFENQLKPYCGFCKAEGIGEIGVNTRYADSDCNAEGIRPFDYETFCREWQLAQMDVETKYVTWPFARTLWVYDLGWSESTLDGDADGNLDPCMRDPDGIGGRVFGLRDVSDLSGKV